LREREEVQRELIALYREKTMLQAAAYIWERHAGHRCEGQCEAPIVVARDVDGVLPISCCEMYPAHARLGMVRKTEALLRAKLRAAIVVVPLALAGCAEAPTSDGSTVREIRGEDTAGCEFVGVVNATGNADSTAVALANAKRWLRIGVEAKGGNAVVVLDSRASMTDQYMVGNVIAAGRGEAAATGEAYRCVYAGPTVSTPDTNSASRVGT
jgi:hypothetical protein